MDHLGLPPLARAIENWSRGYGLFAIEERVTGSFIGTAGLAAPFRCVGPQLLCAVLPNWRRSRDAECDSPAVRACHAVLIWAKTQSLTVFAHVDRNNDRGNGLVRTLGGKPTHPSVQGYNQTCMLDYHFS